MEPIPVLLGREPAQHGGEIGKPVEHGAWRVGPLQGGDIGGNPIAFAPADQFVQKTPTTGAGGRRRPYPSRGLGLREPEGGPFPPHPVAPSGEHVAVYLHCKQRALDDVGEILRRHHRRHADMVAGDRLEVGGEAVDLRGRPVVAARQKEAQDVDQACWLVATRHGDLLLDDGPAAHLRPGSLDKHADGYGRWLTWLAEQGELEEADAPAARAGSFPTKVQNAT